MLKTCTEPREVNAFFESLTTRSGLYDRTTVERVYHAVVKEIIAELRENGKAVLPNWGVFTAYKRKESKFHHIKYNTVCVKESTREVRFRPCIGLQTYIRGMRVKHEDLNREIVF
jgi:nucleoid DNA-binding protein